MQVRKMNDEDRERFLSRRGTSRTQRAVHLGQERVREFREQKPKYVPKGKGNVSFR